MSKETHDYGIFKKHFRNRELNEGNVYKIMRSIEFNNLLHRRPIEVNAKMEVMDGQHRLEAAKRLNVPVYYEVKDDMTAEDIARLNDNQKGWGRDDYLNFFATGGNDHYLRLRNFMQKHKLSLTASLTALNQGQYSTKTAEFKTGTYKYPSLEDELEALEIMDKSKQVVDYLLGKSLSDMRFFLTGQRFQRCLYLFFSLKSVDFGLFMKKLGHKMNLIRPATRLKEILLILQSIYNWNNQNPINLQEISKNED